MVRPGYKQTEVGVIPEDWTVRSLGSCAQLKNGYAFKSSTYTPLGDYRVVTIANVQDGYMEVSESNRIADLPSDVQSHHSLEIGDVLISMTGNVGRVCRVDTPRCVLNQRVGKLVPTGVDSTFLFHLLRQQRFRTAMTVKAKGGAQGNLSVRDIIDFPFPIPPIADEQEAVAGALSDADALIESLVELIAKKRQIKQGTMQELLTGKTRLPGFTGEWKVESVGNLGNCFAGGTPSTTRSEFWDGSIYWLQSGRIQNCILEHPLESDRRITPLGLENSAARLVRPEAVLVAITGATCGNVALLEFAAAANQSVVAIEPNPSVSSRYLYYAMLMKRNEILALRGGSAQGGTNLKSMKTIHVCIPAHSEQKAIAATLFDMDLDIAVSEAKLAKARQIKQGMMQELLTGRIRLV